MEFLAGLRIPNLQVTKIPAGETLAVWAEDHASVRTGGIPFEHPEFLASLGIPHLHIRGLFGDATESRQAFAVRAEGHTVHSRVVPLEGEEFLAGLRIPHFHQTGDLRSGAP